MTLPRPPRARAVTLGCAVALSLTLLGQSGSAVGQPKSAGPRPGPTATRAGIEPGNAPMGWRHAQLGPRLPSGRLGADARTRSAARAPVLGPMSGVVGIDVASYQGNVDWKGFRAQGRTFAYVKATEGTSYRNPYFTSQYNGAYTAGLYRGAYHFANPAGASGTAQANYFVDHGGAWSRNTRRLPGVLDIEYNPYGSTCYGLSRTAMVSWISAFVTQYKKRTTRDAVIYTTTDWWSRCTGNSTKFTRTNPLWVARYASAPGTLPGGWPYYTFWQYSSSPLDQDRFSASPARLQVLANNG